MGPNIPPPAQQEELVNYLKRRVKRCEKEDARGRREFAAAQKDRDEAEGKGGTENGASSEVLPRHQRLSTGKPAICRPMAQNGEAMQKMMRAEDSHFTSEYRRSGFWKTTIEGQKKEIKEHVRPYDSWTKFRDNAASVNKFSRYPINTY